MLTEPRTPDEPAHSGAGRALLTAAMLLGVGAAGLSIADVMLGDGGALDVAIAAATGTGLSLLSAGWRQAALAERATAEVQARALANAQTDALTGLMNRVAFHAALDAIEHASDGVTVVLFFDLDRFKDVNDTLGHKAGDDLLVQVAERTIAALPPTAKIARLGGDEFAAILPWDFGCLPEHYGRAVRDALAAPFAIAGNQVEIGGSVGIAVGDGVLIAGSELLRRADIAMYAAKAQSVGQVRLFDDDLDQRQTRESSVRSAVGAAIIADQFRLHYQPLVEARTGRLHSAEALIRSQAPGLRDVSPASLIATVEASGQIHALTDWTIEEALRAAARLDGLPIAVNISPVYFRHPDFVEKVLDRLIRAQVPPERLILEITEGVLIENMEAARHALGRLREVGVRFHLDDFGTGYSSLGYIQNFELDGLKLDKSFLRNIGDRRRTDRIVRSMIDFGHSLDMRVVVEGVESEWQARLLQQLGADVLQGYEIAMPMPLAELTAFRDALADEPWLPQGRAQAAG